MLAGPPRRTADRTLWQREVCPASKESQIQPSSIVINRGTFGGDQFPRFLVFNRGLMPPARQDSRRLRDRVRQAARRDLLWQPRLACATILTSEPSSPGNAQ